MALMWLSLLNLMRVQAYTTPDRDINRIDKIGREKWKIEKINVENKIIISFLSVINETNIMGMYWLVIVSMKGVIKPNTINPKNQCSSPNETLVVLTSSVPIRCSICTLNRTKKEASKKRNSFGNRDRTSISRMNLPVL